MTQTRINIRTAVNSSRIRRERRNGRDVIVVPSATLPDDIVMNGIRYEAGEIEKSYATLENTPAPLGHPNIDGAFVSASDPRGMVRGFVGAWNENVRREGGRVHLDKVIDVEFASQLEGGKAILEAINKGDPIHTSTGLLAVLEPIENDADASRVARDIIFDHDAILLGEQGAATPDQGVGMLVNGEQIEVVNSTLTEEADREVDWAVDNLVRAVQRRENVPLLERIKSSILSLIRGEDTGPTPAINTEQDDMSVTEEQFKTLESKVDGLVSGIGETIANAIKDAIAPLATQTEALTNAAKAAEDAELDGLRAQIVNANLMPEDAAKELTLNAARALAAQAAPKKAFGLFNGVATEDDAPTYDLPE